MKDDRILIDTSVWINYFHGKDNRLAGIVDDVLTYWVVYVPKVVIAELIQGAKSEKEISVVEQFVETFHIIDHTGDTWRDAGKLAFSMKRKGETVPLIDCYIAIMASENNCMMFSLDDHFRMIKNFTKLDLYIPHSRLRNSK